MIAATIMSGMSVLHSLSLDTNCGQYHIDKDGSSYAAGLGINLFTHPKLIHNGSVDSPNLDDISVGFALKEQQPITNKT